MESCGGGGGGVVEGRKRGRVKSAGEEPEAKRRMPEAALAPWAAAAQPQPQHPASRIYRVSRASGGKDRHSKVYTAKGIRDRRVRLSVATAIQFYDLQDRLGYDQPSKAIEWLIKAAADAIDKLPSLEVAAAGFPSHPASAAAAAGAGANKGTATPPPAEDADDDDDDRGNQQRSGCSSTSETSKGSVLSLSRSESRVKARERARERSAAARDKDPADDRRAPPAATTSSFTELLTGMATAAATAAAPSPVVAEHKQQQQSSISWTPMAVSATTADYIGFAQPRKAGHAMAHSHLASPAPHLGSSIGVTPAQKHFGLPAGAVTVASGGGEPPHAEMTQFSFLQDHFMPVHATPPPASGAAGEYNLKAAASGAAGEYNLNFSISSGLVGVNGRGTLQSNSHISGHHHHHHQQQLQRLSAPVDAPNIPFLFSPAAADTQFAAFQLWNGIHHADIKEKGKN